MSLIIHVPTEFVAPYPPKLSNLAGEVESQGASERSTKIYEMAKWLNDSYSFQVPFKVTTNRYFK